MFLWMVYSTLMALMDDLRVTTQYWIPSTIHGFTPVLLDTRCISFWIFLWVCVKMLSLFHLVFIKLSLGLISIIFYNFVRKEFSTILFVEVLDCLRSAGDWSEERSFASPHFRHGLAGAGPRGDSCHLPWATLTCKMQNIIFCSIDMRMTVCFYYSLFGKKG